MTILPILHFNDVYRVSQKVGRSGETIDVTQFAALVDELRGGWAEQPQHGKREGLVLFSGDVFSPSVESSVTRGSHMVPVMNEIGIDVALTGNHDFDFGYPHLTKLVQDSSFPWILSNIIDTTTSKVPEYLYPFQVLERCGARIGLIGVVEKDWVATVPSWPTEFEYKEMASTAIELSKLLRDPNGEYRCDIIIALSHSRLPNDVRLAGELLALSPSTQTNRPVVNEHGADILLGGHDHSYFVSKGIDEWEGHDNSQVVLGAEEDKGDILVVKSGYDFRELSEIVLELEDAPEGSIRRKVIKKITGKRHAIQPGMKSSPTLTEVLRNVLSSVTSAMKAPVCRTTTTLDLRSRYLRVGETASANWIADVIRHAYDDALCLKGCGGSDGVIISAGTLRGDSTYGPGVVTLGDIMEILPFDDPVVVLELDGGEIWDALEAALGSWPAQEGRFPVISGLRVTWDSRLPPGKRVLTVSLLRKSPNHEDGGSPKRIVEEEPILRDGGDKKYKIVTREYMAEGHDGYTALKRGTFLIDHESGSIMSIIVRKYLLGCQFVNKLLRLGEEGKQNLSRATRAAAKGVLEERNKRDKAGGEGKAASRWKHAIDLVIHRSRSHAHYQNHLNVSAMEDMSPIDAFDGSAARKGREFTFKDTEGDQDLLVISPELDGRLKDVGRDTGI